MGFTASKVVKVRKPHYCFWCGILIDPGLKAHKHSGVDDEGYWLTEYTHEECETALTFSECTKEPEYSCDAKHERGQRCMAYEPWRAGDDIFVGNLAAKATTSQLTNGLIIRPQDVGKER
jgi:hypothetical protein